MGGTSLSGCTNPVLSVLPRLCRGVEPRDRSRAPDTLLGPEGSGPVEHLRAFVGTGVLTSLMTLWSGLWRALPSSG